MAGVRSIHWTNAEISCRRKIAHLDIEQGNFDDAISHLQSPLTLAYENNEKRKVSEITRTLTRSRNIEQVDRITLQYANGYREKFDVI